ncbi:MAG: protocatechuate 3,4-dioxygenase subunit alpha [Candidatus Sulfotelmatobacter sp.]
MDRVPTPSQTAGPYFHLGMTEIRSVKRIAVPHTRGERVWLTCRVIDGANAPVNDAMIEVWQADAEGKYNHPDDLPEKTVDAEWIGFGRMATAEDGSCEFETVRPGRVLGSGNTMQAPHLNVAVFARGMLKQLYTRIYFAGDPANSEDPAIALVPALRRETLMAQPEGAAGPSHWCFDIHLQGEKETVFFDV